MSIVSSSALSGKNILATKKLSNSYLGAKKSQPISTSARSINKPTSNKNLEVVSYRRDVPCKKGKRQPRLNNMKQIFINSPNHANVDLRSPTSSQNNSIDSSFKSLNYREKSEALSRLKANTDDGSQPRDTK